MKATNQNEYDIPIFDILFKNIIVSKDILTKKLFT